MKYVLREILAFAALTAVVLGLVGCREPVKVSGVVHTYDLSPLALKTRTGEMVYLNHEEFVVLRANPKQMVFSSALILETRKGTLEISIPKISFVNGNSFVLKSVDSGQSFNIYGFRQQIFKNEWEEEGQNTCIRPGDCGHMQYTLDSKGQVNGGYWVSAACWGSQRALFSARSYDHVYRIEFEGKGHIVGVEGIEVKKTVKKELSPCH